MPSAPLAAVPAVGSGSIDRLPPHRNPALEIVFIERGKLRWSIEGRAHLVRPGSVFFTYPWETHGGVEDFEPGHHWHWVWIAVRTGGAGREAALRFSPALGLTAREEREAARTLSRAPRCLPAGEPLQRLIPQLVVERLRPGGGEAGIVTALARLVVLELARKIREGAAAPGADGDRRVNAFLSALETEVGEPWTLAEMAARCRLHRTRFAEIVRVRTGDTPLGYLRRLRVRQAQHLLRTTNRDVTTIALEVGFSTSQHFAREFKRFTGTTAVQYRAREAARVAGGPGRMRRPAVLGDT